MRHPNLRICLALLLLSVCALLCGCDVEKPPVPAVTTAVPATTEIPSATTALVTTVPVTTVAPETAAPKPPRTPSAVTVTEADIPAFSGGTGNKLYDCGDGALMRYISGALSSEYEKYLTKLADAGYTQSWSEELNNNRFAGFTKDGIALHVYYVPADTAVRIIAEPAQTTARNDRAEVTEPLITQIGLNFTAQVNGMSYLLRCASGAFIIIDGGWKGEGESDKLFNLLKEQQIPGGTNEMPRIAAWIITHPHSDHIGVIDEFSRMYGDQVELERVICNFVSDDVLKTADAKAMLEVGGSVRNLRNRLNTGCWSDTAIIKPHTGQLLEIDDAKIRIWSTHEDVYPDTEALAYMNAASLTFTVTLGDTDFLVLGDATNKVTAAMAKRYGSLMACDILQPTHHGTTGGRVDLYQLCDPKICLWPTTNKRLDEYRSKDYNQYLLNSAVQHYVSSDGHTMLTLPLS